MKLPSMTKGKHWFSLSMFIIAEAVLAFVCFTYPPFGFIGLILVVAANIEWVAAAIIGIRNLSKQG